jgi:hypothetical protein
MTWKTKLDEFTTVRDEFMEEFSILSVGSGTYSIGIGKEPHPNGELCLSVSGTQKALDSLPDTYKGVPVRKRVGTMPYLATVDRDAL